MEYAEGSTLTADDKMIILEKVNFNNLVEQF